MAKGILGFLQETKQELNKVTWPAKDEVWQATVVVIVVMLIMATYIGAVDAVCTILMRILLG